MLRLHNDNRLKRLPLIPIKNVINCLLQKPKQIIQSVKKAINLDNKIANKTNHQIHDKLSLIQSKQFQTHDKHHLITFYKIKKSFQ